MGTIHKFKRPPRNEKQFKGYRPTGSAGLRPASGHWQKLRPWQKSAIAWLLLIAIAAAIVGVRALLAMK